MCDEGGGSIVPQDQQLAWECGSVCQEDTPPFLFHTVLWLWVSTIGTKEEGDREITSSRESPPVRAKKPRKARTAFSDHQLNQLERSFERQKYLSVQDRMDLAAALNLTDTQVKTWYQNRR